jgi:hypothetical protein
MSKKKYRTDFLTPHSGLFVAMGAILNLRGKYFSYNYSNSANEADCKAIENDWGMVGNDLHNAIKNTPKLK